MTTASTPSCQLQNALVNPSFETGNLSPWQAQYPTLTNVIQSSDSYDGGYYLELIVNTEDDSNYISQVLTGLDVNTIYTVGVEIQWPPTNDGAEPCSVDLIMNDLDSGTLIGFGGATSDWTSINGTYQPLSSQETLYIHSYCPQQKKRMTPEGNSAVALDAATFSPLSCPTSTSTQCSTTLGTPTTSPCTNTATASTTSTATSTPCTTETGKATTTTTGSNTATGITTDNSTSTSMTTEITTGTTSSTSSAGQSTGPTTTSRTESLTISTILTTRIATITACPSTVTNCPATAKTTYLTTETVVAGTTVIPVGTLPITVVGCPNGAKHCTEALKQPTTTLLATPASIQTVGAVSSATVVEVTTAEQSSNASLTTSSQSPLFTGDANRHVNKSSVAKSLALAALCLSFLL